MERLRGVSRFVAVVECGVVGRSRARLRPCDSIDRSIHRIELKHDKLGGGYQEGQAPDFTHTASTLNAKTQTHCCLPPLI